MKGAPSLANAPKIGIAANPVSPHHATRSPRPTPRAASARATWLVRASSSPKVRSSSPIVAASRRTTAAACRITFPTSRPMGGEGTPGLGPGRRTGAAARSPSSPATTCS